MSICTRTGDDGTTGLIFNRRVSKSHPRVRAYGAVDELNAALGMARAFSEDEPIAEEIHRIQRELVIVMGELAVDDDDRLRYAEKGRTFVDAEMADRLTSLIRNIEKNDRIRYEGWVMPGGSRFSACLDLARTTCRRAEREVVALHDEGALVTQDLMVYLNRLSDLCWIWGRLVESRIPRPACESERTA
jgi:cob(I)alamin adenosyltransferase